MISNYFSKARHCHRTTSKSMIFMMGEQMLLFQCARLTVCPVSLELQLFAFFFLNMGAFENTLTLN